MEPDKLNDGTSVDQVTVWIARAEEFERAFYSYRTLEWQIHTMYYAGLVAVTAGLWTLASEPKLQPALIVAPGALVIATVFAVSGWLQARVQERMRYVTEKRTICWTLIHDAVPGSRAIKPEALEDPKHPRYWASRPMFLVNFTAGVACVAAVALKSTMC